MHVDEDSVANITQEVNQWLIDFCTAHDHFYIAQAFAALDSAENPGQLRSELTVDGVHLNLRGYEVLGQTMAKALEKIVMPGTVVLLLGDSITAGYPEHDPGSFNGAEYGDPKHTFAYWLEQYLRCKTLNKGICGDTTTGMAQRLGQYLKTAPKPDFVLVQGGANDFAMLFYGSEPKAIADRIKINFRYIHELCAWQGIRLIYLPILPMTWELLDG